MHHALQPSLPALPASPSPPCHLPRPPQIRASLWKPQWQRPYLFGAQARPACTNCREDKLWAHFCQYRSHGPICPDWVQQVGAGAPQSMRSAELF